MRISRYDFQILSILTLSLLVVYSGIWECQFVNYDDDIYIVNNPRVNSGLTYENVFWAFNEVYAANWHPLTWISHMTDVEWFGLDPAGHHVVNALLHLTNSCLVFIIFRYTTEDIWKPAMMAGLFALHPLHVEPVAWVSQRKEIISFTFGAVSILLYTFWAKKRMRFFYLGSLISFTCALASKPIWVTLPALLILFDYWPLGRLNPKKEIFRRFVEKIPFFFFSAGSAWITVFAQKTGLAVRTFDEYSLLVRVANACSSYATYLGQTFLPLNLIVFYPHQGETISLPVATGAFVFLTVITSFAVVKGKKAPFFLMGWLWYLIALSPVIGIIQVGEQAHADRYTYVSLVGVFITIIWGTESWVVEKGTNKALIWITGIGVLLTLAILSYQQTSYWRNSLDLYEHTLSRSPRNRVAIQNYSASLLDRAKQFSKTGKWDKVESDLKLALKMKPDLAEAEIVWGNLLVKENDLYNSIGHYRQAIQIDNKNPNSYRNLGLVQLRLGDYEGAALNFRETLARKPDQPYILNNLGSILYGKGDTREAEEWTRKAAKLLPSNSGIHYNLAMILAEQGKREEAKSHLRSALKSFPNFYKAQLLLRELGGKE